MPSRYNGKMTLCLWIEEDIAYALDAIAEELDTSISELSREIYTAFIEAYRENKNEIKRIRRTASTKRAARKRILGLIFSRIRFFS